MLCKLDPDIDYTTIHSNIKEQLEFVKQAIDRISLSKEPREPPESLKLNGFAKSTKLMG
jgi:hypothetical protein